MRHFPISVNYGIDISHDQLKRILAKEERESAQMSDVLACRLTAIPGVSEVNYSDLSDTIFLTVKSTFDHQLTWEVIWTAIYNIGGNDTCRGCKEDQLDGLVDDLCPTCYERMS